MTIRDTLTMQYYQIIQNQLQENDPKSTNIAFESLLHKGMSEERAMQKLAWHLENTFHTMIDNNEQFDTTSWDSKMQDVINETYIVGDIDINDYKLSKIGAKIKKAYGGMKHGTENQYLAGLYCYESSLFHLHKIYQLSVDDLKAILSIALYQLYGNLHDETYNFEEVVTEDLIYMANVLTNSCNPYVNTKRNSEMEEIIGMDREIPQESYKNSLYCMVRILEGMDFWTKKHGSNGYIQFLSDSMHDAL